MIAHIRPSHHDTHADRRRVITGADSFVPFDAERYIAGRW